MLFRSVLGRPLGPVDGRDVRRRRPRAARSDGVRAPRDEANGEDAFLVVRGSRTAALRIRASEAAALELARRLDGHPRAGRVLHPALPSQPGHALWQRDFHGSSGLFAFELLAADGAAADGELVDAFTDRLVARGRFGLGYSWGGYEWLVMPHRWSRSARDVRPWTGGELIRLHIGTEPVDGLWADLRAAFEADG